MISILIDPGYQPPRPLPVVPQVKLDQPEPSYPLDVAIVNFMQDQSEPISTWSMVNSVAATFHPPNRAASRELKKQILGRITRLVHSRRLRRVGRKYLTLR
jgi:hypothetical protein